MRAAKSYTEGATALSPYSPDGANIDATKLTMNGQLTWEPSTVRTNHHHSPSSFSTNLSSKHIRPGLRPRSRDQPLNCRMVRILSPSISLLSHNRNGLRLHNKSLHIISFLSFFLSFVSSLAFRSCCILPFFILFFNYSFLSRNFIHTRYFIYRKYSTKFFDRKNR